MTPSQLTSPSVMLFLTRMGVERDLWVIIRRHSPSAAQLKELWNPNCPFPFQKKAKKRKNIYLWLPTQRSIKIISFASIGFEWDPQIVIFRYERIYWCLLKYTVTDSPSTGQYSSLAFVALWQWKALLKLCPAHSHFPRQTLNTLFTGTTFLSLLWWKRLQSPFS